jgi:hypothetical protein
VVDHAVAVDPPVLLPLGYISTFVAPCEVVPPWSSTHIEAIVPVVPQLVSLVAMLYSTLPPFLMWTNPVLRLTLSERSMYGAIGASVAGFTTPVG